MEIRVTQLSELLSHLKTNEEPVKQNGPARRDASPRGRLRLTRSEHRWKTRRNTKPSRLKRAGPLFKGC